MALVLADRVQQTGTANTTVSFTLSGTVTGFQSFAVVGNGNTTYYSSFDTSGNWEVGLGTYSTTGPTLTRTTVVSSSNAGAAVTFSGSVNVFLTYPAEYAVWASSAPTTSGYVLTSNGTGVAPSWQQGGAGTITVTDFTATSGQTVFTVSYTVGLVEVYRNGIKLGNADYTATSGTSITLATGAVTGDLVEVVAFSSLNLYSTITYQDFNGDGTTTIFTMNAVPANAASLLVAISGVVQDPSTYTVVGTTLTFSAAPPSGTNNVSVRYLGIPSVGSVSSFSAGTTGLTPASNTTGAVTLAGTLNVANGGTGLTSLTAGYIPYGNGTSAFGSSANLTFDGSTLTTLNSAYTGTLTGGTGIVNLGSGQFYKDASGNIGIGVTPSAWFSSGNQYQAIQFKDGWTSVANDDGNGTAIFGSNLYASANSVFKYVNNNFATMYQQNLPSGQHRWYVAPSGTAGNTITFTQSLTLNNNGVLALQGASTSATGVGITFPATQSASSDANTLDDYEEGTWTPTATNFTINSGSASWSGVYTKVGRLVTAYFRVSGGNFTVTAGSTTITLPFTVATYDVGGFTNPATSSGFGGLNAAVGSASMYITTTTVAQTQISGTITYSV